MNVQEIDTALAARGLPTYSSIFNALAARAVAEEEDTQVFNPDNHYEAHGANTGGLQAHSIGGTFPITVIGLGIGDRTLYAAYNTATDERGAYRVSYAAALLDIQNGSIFDSRPT